MNIYTAIMKAADHIERHPSQFKFAQLGIPPRSDCGTPGCALGWIGFFAGKRGGLLGPVCRNEATSPARQLALTPDGPLLPMELTQKEFYERMNEAVGGGWSGDAAICSAGLRLYAAKYHAPTKPVQQPPDWQAMAAIQTVAADVRSQEVAS